MNTLLLFSNEHSHHCSRKTSGPSSNHRKQLCRPGGYETYQRIGRKVLPTVIIRTQMWKNVPIVSALSNSNFCCLFPGVITDIYRHDRLGHHSQSQYSILADYATSPRRHGHAPGQATVHATTHVHTMCVCLHFRRNSGRAMAVVIPV
jgi:hypothetical protein